MVLNSPRKRSVAMFLILTLFVCCTATTRLSYKNSSATSLVRDVKGSNEFKYNGGRLMVDPITIRLTWFGSWPESSKQVIRNAIVSLSVNDAEFPSLFNWWQIVTQYKDERGRPVSSNVTLSKLECSVPAQEATSDTLREEVSEKCSKMHPRDQDSINIVVISRSVVTSGTFYCAGEFLSAKKSGTPDYYWLRESQPDEFCNLWKRFGGFKGAPNGDSSLDSLVSMALARIAETATNPSEDGWKDFGEATVSSKCPSPLGWDDSTGPVMEEDGISWNLFGVNGSRYMVQQLWSETSDNCALQIIKSCEGFTTLDQPRGYISEGLVMNHKVGLQPYRPGLICAWSLEIPYAKIIRVTLKYMSVGVGDELKISSCPYSSLLKPYMFSSPVFRRQSCNLTKSMVGASDERNLPDVVGSILVVDFITSKTQALQSFGWELFYQAGYCYGTEVLDKHSTGFISDGSPEGAHYLENHECKWLLNAREGTKVSLRIIRLDTVQDLDFLTIYKGDDVLEVFSGAHTSDIVRSYTGPVTLVFSTQTGNGTGWSAYYIMEHPSLEVESKHLIAIVLGVVSGMLSLVGGLKFLQCWLFRRVLNKPARRFSRTELEAATDNFSEDRVVAPELFRGVLTNDQLVTVQRFQGSCCEKEYEILSKIKHPNVATVIGVCYDVRDSFLVFRNMSNGSLAEYLFSEEKCAALTWERRLRIGAQVARALGNLHTYAEPCVVHRDVNSKHIFLDSSWNAKLGGFSNALAVREKPSGVSSAEPLLKAEDVYNMGVLILELLTGQCAWDEEDRTCLTAAARWAAHLIDTGGGYLILDRRIPVPLERDTSSMALLKLAEIGAWCMREKTRERPNMVEVAAVLGQVEAMYFGVSSSAKRRRAASWA